LRYSSAVALFFIKRLKSMGKKNCGLPKVAYFSTNTYVGSNSNMTLQNFIARLNWRQILLHFIATIFLIFAFQQFAYLFKIDIIDAIRKSRILDKETYIEIAKKNNWSPGQLLAYLFYINLFWLLGLILGFIISLTISKTKKWFWVNSLIVLLAAFILARQDLLGWTYLKTIFLKPGEIFSNSTMYILTNGLVLLIIGLFVFYYEKCNNFINSKKW
jgi:hypothetical protein